MTDFMHCNCCYILPSAEASPKYFLTNCFHILCQSCLQKETGNPLLCPVCNHEMRTVEINSAMDQRLQDLFKPPKKLIQEKMAALKRRYDFQQMLVKSLLGHLKKQREKLSQLMEYCQRQSQISKEQAKELGDLKKWVKTAEIKMRESEEEKASLLKELENMKKSSRRFDRDSNYESTIDKLFAEADCRHADDTECASSLSFNGLFGTSSKAEVPSFLQTNSEIDGMSTPASSIGHNVVVSPQTSINSSAISELTTPKMLGIAKRGHSGLEGNVQSSRKTPSKMDAQNPYVELFTRSSLLQKCAGRPTGNNSGVVSSAKCGLPRLHSKPPTISGYVTRGKIIPHANTPSNMNRDSF